MHYDTYKNLLFIDQTGFKLSWLQMYLVRKRSRNYCIKLTGCNSLCSFWAAACCNIVAFVSYGFNSYCYFIVLNVLGFKVFKGILKLTVCFWRLKLRQFSRMETMQYLRQPEDDSRVSTCKCTSPYTSLSQCSAWTNCQGKPDTFTLQDSHHDEILGNLLQC